MCESGASNQAVCGLFGQDSKAGIYGTHRRWVVGQLQDAGRYDGQRTMSVQGQRLNRAEALELLHGVMLDGVTSSDPDLSPRQLVILTTVYLKKGPHTVRSLAKTLGVTKAVVTRALDTLAGHGYLSRADDPRDGRSVVIQQTAKGHAVLNALGDTICQTLKIVRMKSQREPASASPRIAAEALG